jgi:hypothetical protein
LGQKCQLKRQRQLKKISLISISLNNSNVIGISLEVVLKISLIFKINQTEFVAFVFLIDIFDPS